MTRSGSSTPYSRKSQIPPITLHLETRFQLILPVDSQKPPNFKVVIEWQKRFQNLILSISKQSDTIHRNHPKHSNLENHCFGYIRPQKSPKIAQENDHSNAIFSIFLIGMVYFLWYLVNPHVKKVQNMYGKGGQRVSKAELRPLKVDPYFKITSEKVQERSNSIKDD